MKRALRLSFCVLALALGGLLVGSARAEVPDASASGKSWLSPRDDATPDRAASASSESVGARVSLGLLAVSLAGGALWLFLRGTRQRGPRVDHVRVRVLGSARLGPKAHAVVTSVGSRVLLLGVTEQSVRRLAWLDAALEPAAELSEAAPDASPELAPPQLQVPTKEVLPAAIVKHQPARKRGQRFGDALLNAIGRGPLPPDLLSAAEQIAEETEDHFEAGPRDGQARPQMIDVEGQAAGLAARLQRRR